MNNIELINKVTIVSKLTLLISFTGFVATLLMSYQYAEFFSLILQVMAHTWVSFSFLLLLTATLFRVLLPIFGWFTEGYILAACCWGAGFSIYVIYYSPMLLTARPDGRSG